MKWVVAGATLLIAGCSTGYAAKKSLCVDSNATRVTLAASARVALSKEPIQSNWDSKTTEHFLFNGNGVAYMVDFNKPPVLYASVFFSCDGSAGQIHVNRWGTLGD